MSVQTGNLNEHSRECQRIHRWLNERTGIFFAEHKTALLQDRLQRVCAKLGLADLEALAVRLESGQDADLHIMVLDAVTTNHTYFFREPQILDYFRQQVMPTLPDDDWRIWSAAASSGDEAYTLGMIVAQSKGRAWARRNLRILGTDVSETALRHAECGIYDAARLEKTSPVYRRHYFESVDERRFRVAEDLRQVCLFRRLNLKAWPYPFQQRFHVVFCRNVLYYFDKPHQREILDNLYQVTEPGGWLLTSVTESLGDLDVPWQRVATGIYRKES